MFVLVTLVDFTDALQRAFARDSTCKAPWGAAIAPPQIDQQQQQQQQQPPPPDVVDLTVDDESD